MGMGRWSNVGICSVSLLVVKVIRTRLEGYLRKANGWGRLFVCGTNGKVMQWGWKNVEI